MRPEVRSSIKTRLQRDGKVLFWLYSAGLFEAGRESLERVREVTGIALKPQPFHSKPGTTFVNLRHELCSAIPQDDVLEGGHLEPSFFAIPEDDSVILGEYTQTGLPSFVLRETHSEDGSSGSWTSIFWGEPLVTPSLFRALGQIAGCHVWNFDDDTVNVHAPFLTVHAKGAGSRTLTLPNSWSAYNVITEEWEEVKAGKLQFQAIDGATYVFMVGVKSDIEALLDTDPKEALTISEIPSREDNTKHWDHIQFDVQVMKLDEWVEEAWSDQLAEELLLKPSMLDVDQEEDEDEDLMPRSRRGSRRRRGRRGGTKRPRPLSEEGETEEHADSGINVMFRKRE